MEAQKRIFVVGSARSGTTLLGSAIGQHVSFAKYRAESLILSVGRHRYGSLKSARRQARFENDFAHSRQFVRSGLSRQQLHDLVKQSRGDWLVLLTQFHDQMASNQRKIGWIDSTPSNVSYLNEIARGIPSAKVVHMIRDGRSVAASRRALGWTGLGFRNRSSSKLALLSAAFLWERAVNEGRRFGAIYPDRYLELRFEDLIYSPLSSLKRVEDFVGVAGISNSGLSMFETTTDANSAFGPLSQASTAAERWRNTLNESEVALLELHVGPTLDLLGYSRSTNAVPTLRDVGAGGLRYFLDLKNMLANRTPLGRWSGVRFESPEA